MSLRNTQCWRILFLLLFLTDIVSLCHLLHVKPGWIVINFLVWLPPLFISRMARGILQERLFIWWDFCCSACFFKTFFRISVVHFSYFFFHLCCYSAAAAAADDDDASGSFLETDDNYVDSAKIKRIMKKSNISGFSNSSRNEYFWNSTYFKIVFILQLYFVSLKLMLKQTTFS